VELLETCRQAIAEANHSELSGAAHTLKGMIGTFDTAAGYELAGELETIGREGREMERAARVLGRMEEHITRLLEALQALKEDQA
jgi:HPt (histidine-containing phosphotransfer) domain-containing protein